MRKVSNRAINAVINALETSGAWKATKFVNDGKSIVRATVKRERRKIVERGGFHVLLTFARPNHRERKLLKAMRKAGMSKLAIQRAKPALQFLPESRT